jgi:putative hydrolase of the HAD superfamily
MVRNLIIDLGGVLYGVDQTRTYDALRKLVPAAGGTRLVLPEDMRHLGGHALFSGLETGRLGPGDFREALRSEMGVVGSDEDIDAAWNAMLLGVIPGRIRDLRTLGGHYRMVLLSNTNIIHARHFSVEIKPLFACFERCFLSFEMGMRKPDPGIYREVLRESGMIAEESLFIDDSEVNVAGGEKAGLQVFCLPDDAEASWNELMARLVPAD